MLLLLMSIFILCRIEQGTWLFISEEIVLKKFNIEAKQNDSDIGLSFKKTNAAVTNCLRPKSIVS